MVTREELIKAINELEKNPKDRLTFLTDIGAVGVGAVGFGAAASAFGGTTLSLAFGLVAIPVAAPLTVVGGAALLGGAAVMGAKRFFVDGTAADERRKILLKNLKQKLQAIENKEQHGKTDEKDRLEFLKFLRQPLELKLITAEEAQQYILLVEKGEIPLSEAYQVIREILLNTQESYKD